MSGFYSASQFDHAFKPTMLRNWEYATNPFPGKHATCAPSRCGGTGFIAGDNGFLCQTASRNPSTSPWGDYALHIWEQSPPCCCIDKHRHPELYRPPVDIYITNVPPKTKPKKKDEKPFVTVDPTRFAKELPIPVKPIPVTNTRPSCNKKKKSQGKDKDLSSNIFDPVIFGQDKKGRGSVTKRNQPKTRENFSENTQKDLSCNLIFDPSIFGQDKDKKGRGSVSKRNQPKKREEYSENTQILLEQRDAKRKEGKKKSGDGVTGVGERRRKGKRGESCQEPIVFRFPSCEEETNKPKRKPKWRNN